MDHDGDVEAEVFTSIVVPLDLESSGDRALPTASALALGAGIPLELITVSSPGIPEYNDLHELRQRADATKATCTVTVLHDNDAADAIVSFLADRPSSLVVMATHARGVLGDFVLGGVTESVLARVDQPIVLVGPRADIGDASQHPALVAGVDSTAAADGVLPALAAWAHSFGGPPVLLVEVRSPREAPDHGDSQLSSPLEQLTARLHEQGTAATGEVVVAKNTETALMHRADRAGHAVLVVASARWTDPDHPHFASLARSLTQHARHPVLIARAG